MSRWVGGGLIGESVVGGRFVAGGAVDESVVGGWSLGGEYAAESLVCRWSVALWYVPQMELKKENDISKEGNLFIVGIKLEIISSP